MMEGGSVRGFSRAEAGMVRSVEPGWGMLSILIVAWGNVTHLDRGSGEETSTSTYTEKSSAEVEIGQYSDPPGSSFHST